MTPFWINKQRNNTLIIFFNGWGMDEQSVLHIDCGAYDIIELHDYRTLKMPDIGAYQRKILVAWSLGVFMSSLFMKEMGSLDRKIAINGTLNPFHDEFGIPDKIYSLTVEKFNEQSIKEFVQKMFVEEIPKDIITRPVSALKEELISIRSYPPAEAVAFDMAFVSREDKIINPKNQLKFWRTQQGVEIRELEGGHNPFSKFTKWEDLNL